MASSSHFGDISEEDDEDYRQISNEEEESDGDDDESGEVRSLSPGERPSGERRRKIPGGSLVWDEFRHDKIQNKAFCRHCDFVSKQKTVNASNLRKHLENRHKQTVYKRLREKEKHRQRKTPSTPTTPSGQASSPANSDVSSTPHKQARPKSPNAKEVSAIVRARRQF